MGAFKQPRRIEGRNDVQRWGRQAKPGNLLMAQRMYRTHLQAEYDERPSKFGRRPKVSELCRTQVYAGKRLPPNSRWAMLIDGRLKIEDLDDEELARGELRNVNGRFGGKQPQWVPKQFIQAMQRQIISRAAERWHSNLLAAQEQLIALGMDPRVDASVRYRALTYVIERSMGKIPDKIEMSATIKPYEELLQGVTVVRDVDIIEGEVENDGSSDTDD
jgi:hypothetical protein